MIMNVKKKDEEKMEEEKEVIIHISIYNINSKDT
jgi:hypothetical protein